MNTKTQKRLLPAARFLAGTLLVPRLRSCARLAGAGIPFPEGKSRWPAAGIVLASLLLSTAAQGQFDIGPLSFLPHYSGEGVTVTDCDSDFTGHIDVPSHVSYERPIGYYETETVTAPVIGIDSYAFWNSKAATITLPQTLQWIGYKAFLDSEFETITIPNSIHTIRQNTFEGCDQLQSVILPLNLQNLEKYAFYGCSSLATITIPGTLLSWEESAFANCRSLSNVFIKDGVKTIGEEAFSGCWALSTVRIPDSVTKIEQSAFSVTGLEEIQIPSSVTSMGWNVFAHTNVRNIVLPDSIEDLGLFLFNGCDDLETVSLGKGIEIIPEGTFMNCMNLRKVAASNSIGFIGKEAFLNCEALASFAIPGSVERIASNAFSGCSALTSMLFPEGLIDVHPGAFSNCANLESCVFLGTAPSAPIYWAADVFAQSPNVTVYGIEGKGFTTPTWNGVPCQIIVPLSEQSIGRAVNVIGAVNVVRGGTTLPIGKMAGIERGDTVITGLQSYAKIEFDKGSVLNIGPKSRIVIDETFENEPVVPTTEMTLLKGGIEIFKSNSGKPLYIRTRSGGFGVRGTTLTVEVSEQDEMVRTVVEVLEGVVEFENESTGETGEIRTGESFSGEVVASSSDTDSLLSPPAPGPVTTALEVQIKKTKAKMKKAKKSGKKAKAKKLKAKLKKLQKKLKALQ